MSRRFFGTDGVRGPYGGDLINENFAGRLARAAAASFRDKHDGALRKVLVGRDTRASGAPLLAAMVDALVGCGLEVLDGGIVPTPAIAGSMDELGAGLGIVVTASHNPPEDNGIKFFASTGRKLTDEEELAIEDRLDSGDFPGVEGGSARSVDVARLYIDRMRKLLPPGCLKDWRIVVDTANGATVETAPAVLLGLGADLILRGHRPNGANINTDVGAQHPEALAEPVLAAGARLGISFDGDGDRVVFCDETGLIMDGDDTMAVLGKHFLKHGRLKKDTLVATVQSNLGLDRALEDAGGKVIRTAVGDRYVIEEIRRGGYCFGGESSGHILMTDISPTGDGLAAALKILEVMLAGDGEPLSRMRQCWKRFPHASIAVNVAKKRPMEELSLLPEAISNAEAALGDCGRVLVRYSGTEQKLRLLVEGEDADLVHALLEPLRAAAVAELAQ